MQERIYNPITAMFIFQLDNTKRLMKPEVAASDIRIYLNRMIDVRLKRECMFVLFIILTARVNGQMIRLVLCC
jgi:hypothetical protein